ncbi:methylenetetrahydrofolate reductase 1 [Coemansia sp. Benny D115]|nr:methylenetetrahydrofolate reductase 1 [Coemansia sp. Benny D115]
MKVSDKIAQAVAAKTPYFSLEFFPPKTEQGLANLYDRIERMSHQGPLFMAVTWGAGGSTAQRTLELCGACQTVFGVDTVMHLTCTNMDRAMLDDALSSAKSAGIRNILALRGDAPRDAEYWTPCDGGFSHAVDLVRYIRQEYGDYFCIGVAGYPEGHVESQDPEDDFRHFLEKVNAGADFVVAQLVYEARLFVEWEQKCRAAGVTVPLVPGVLPVQSYQSFRRLVHLTKAHVPQELRDALEGARANDQAVRDLGVAHAVSMVRELRDAGVLGVHLTTLNLENTVQRVLAELALATPADSARVLRGPQSVAEKALRGIAGVAAVDGLRDDFPNGRWGDARSPAFGTLDAYGAMLKFDPSGAASSAWGRPTSAEDVSKLFTDYLAGVVPSLPWSDEPAMAAETQRIRDELLRINRLGYWTLASQPALDGLPSSDATYGWGPKGGFVYQKAFVECFVPGDMFPAFLSRLQSAAARITYYAANAQGDFLTNAYQGDGDSSTQAETAVTWGVFPGRAVVQPTRIDKMNFLAWRTEAFGTWREWAGMFAPDSPESVFLERTAQECWLINVVDNEFKQTEADDDEGIWGLFQ